MLCWAVGGAAALLLRRGALGARLGVAGAVSGGASLVLAALGALGGRPLSWRAASTLPIGAFALRLDPLAGAFLIPVGVVGAAGAMHGLGYLRKHAHGGPIGGSLAAYQLLLLSMTVVVSANDLVLFLIAWEIMTLSSWALVVTDQTVPGVRAAGTQYLVASHIATSALFLLALSLAVGSGTYDMDALSGVAPVPSAVLFLLATVGFGTKAALAPLHVWLPDAHSAAPPHVSALMSAVMVTMGFYGLARFLPVLGEPQAWWPYVFLVLGAAGAIGGVVFALADRDVKRVLAYSTVENAGIAALAVGLGVLGTTTGDPLLAGLGWTAALLHLWNHALAKGALFLGFGALAQSVGDRNIDRMGGLLARFPVLGALLVLATAAISALPGLNVFSGEWLLIRGFLSGGASGSGVTQAALLAAVAVLATTGGLAVACFVRLAGLSLLGVPRSEGAASAGEPGWLMRAPVLALVAGCIAVASAPAAVANALGLAVATVAPTADVEAPVLALQPLARLLPLVALTTAAVSLLRWAFGRRPEPVRSSTWGCGYPSPSAAMQYTSTSFGEPLTRLLQPFLRTRVHADTHGGMERLWPARMSWTSTTLDRILEAVYLPAVAAVARAGERLRTHSRPRVTTSLLYIVLTVILLLTLLFIPETQR
jgi:formate hydrogenlyase subunit 3/multisubunit Na+/H+ antiporter MnhD subunit